MLTLITPTGERPFAFSLCQKMMQRQTYQGPVRWIVVDDAEVPSPITIRRQGWTMDVIRPEPKWKPGDNTQGRNLLAALDAADPRSLIAFIEDDDWYHPDWISRVAEESGGAELVGEADARYYNVRYRKEGRLRNYMHASLRCSAIRDGAIETFRKVLERKSQYYDFDLWKAHGNKRVFSSRLTVGIKGLPGRPGIAVGHQPQWGRADPELKKLKEWIGEDADLYAGFYEESDMAEKKQTKQMRALTDFKYGELGAIKAGEIFSLRSDREESLFIACGRAAPFEKIRAQSIENPRKMTVETQEQKLAEMLVEKQADHVVEDENHADNEPEPEQADEARKTRGRKKASL